MRQNKHSAEEWSGLVTGAKAVEYREDLYSSQRDQDTAANGPSNPGWGWEQSGTKFSVEPILG